MLININEISHHLSSEFDIKIYNLKKLRVFAIKLADLRKEAQTNKQNCHTILSPKFEH